MKNDIFIKKMISGVLVGGMLLSFGIASFALDSEDNSVSDNVQKPAATRFNFKGFKEDKHQNFINVIKQLVEEGKLTEDKVNSIIDYIEQKQEERQAKFEEIKNMTPEERRELKDELKGTKKDIIEDLEEAGIITTEEADAIRTKNEEIMKEKRNEIIKDRLEKLVEEGIITEDDINEFISYMDKEMEERRAESEKIKDMTAEERKAYMEEKRDERTDVLSKMVEDGIISEEQAEAIKEAMPRPHVVIHHGHKRPWVE